MNTLTRLLMIVTILAACGLASADAGRASAPRPHLAFEENRGQLAPEMKFSARGEGFRLHLTDRGDAVLAGRHAGGTGARFDLRMRWRGARQGRPVAGEAPLPGALNYYSGSDPSRWIEGVRRFGRVRYREVYPGIDVVYYDAGGRIEFDFVVAPGAKPERIAMVFEGAEALAIEADGSLRIRCAGDEIALAAPVVYQGEGAARVEVASAYRLDPDGSVGFSIDRYDVSRELVADPVLLGYSTRLGGSGVDEAQELHYGVDGAIYLAGRTTSNDFLGAGPGSGNSDGFVAKLSADGQTLIYATILGGSNFDFGFAVASGIAGHAYVVGHTESSDFPTLDAYQSDLLGMTDAFFTRLDSNGAIVYSTYYGGVGSDGQFDGGIDVDHDTGRVYIAGRTENSVIPLINAYQTSCTDFCAFVAGFETSIPGPGSLVYSTYLGGDGEEAALDLAVDASGKLYVFGFTSSDAGLVIANEGFQDTSVDVLNYDHFLVVLDPSAAGTSQRLYSSYIGGLGVEPEVGDMTIDGNGLVWIAGETASDHLSFPIKNAIQPLSGGGSDGYVVAVDTRLVGNASLLWSTFVGGSGSDIANGVAVDWQQRVYVIFDSNSPNLPLVDPLPQFAAPDTGRHSGVVMQLSADGQTRLLSTPLPAAHRAEIDGNGELLVMGSTTRLIPLHHALPPSPLGSSELFLARLESFEDTGLVLEALDTLDPATTNETFAVGYLITNTSSEPATNLALTSTLPAPLTEIGLSAECTSAGSQVDCDLYDLGPRESTPVYFRVQSATTGPVAISGSISADPVDPKPGDNSASEQTTLVSSVWPSSPNLLRKSDFDVVANRYDIGEFSLDVRNGVLATANGSLDGGVNFMVFDGAMTLGVAQILGQAEVAFGFVERSIWTPADGDGSDLFGRQYDAAADRVFATVDALGFVSLYTAAAYDPGRLVARGAVDLTRGGGFDLLVDKVGSNAQVLYNGMVVAEGDPFTADTADATPAQVGDDQVISVSYGTEYRGAAILAVPEPGELLLLLVGLIGLLLSPRGRRA